MQIQTNKKGFEGFECNFVNIRKGFETFKCKFESFEKDSKHPKQIRTIQKGFESFQCKFEQLERVFKDLNANSNPSKWI